MESTFKPIYYDRLDVAAAANTFWKPLRCFMARYECEISMKHAYFAIVEPKTTVVG